MFIGLDIGTSATKGVVIDAEGRIIAHASSAYEHDRPGPAWAEHDPAVWAGAACDVLRRLAGSPGVERGSLRGLGLSGQMHGSVFLDDAALRAAGSAEIAAVRPAIMWNDQRSAAQCAAIESAVGRRRLIDRCGNAAIPGFTAPKILWLREHEPRAFERTARVVLPKDFVRLVLTGEVATDAGDASGTLLLDIETRGWASDLLGALGLDPSLFPTVLESCEVAGRVTRWAAERTGLPVGLPVVAGSGDNQCAAVGAGVVEPGVALSVLGTSGVVYVHAGEPRRDVRNDPPGRVHCVCAADGSSSRRGGWANTGVMLSAAGSLHWARSVLAPGVAFEALLAEAEAAPPGCDGLLFLPHLSGERCPYPDPGARGSWVGLTSRHTRGHLVRAVLEGVACTMAIILDIVRGLPVEPSVVRLSGGGNRSALWRAMQADAYGLAVVAMEGDEGPALGAALMASVGVGGHATLAEAARAATREVGRIEPGPARGVYRELTARYRAAFAAMTPVLHACAAAERAG